MFIKDVRSQGGVVQCGNFANKGILQMPVSALFGAKNTDFSKFMVCPYEQGRKGGGG